MRGGRQNSLVTVLALGLVATPAAARAAGGLTLIPDPVLLVVHLTVLAVLIYPTRRLLLDPLARILAERERRTVGARTEAEGLTAKAQVVQQDLQARLQAARADAQARRGSIMAKAAREERRLLEEAREDGGRELESVRVSIALELESARRSLRAEARELAREAAARILGRPL
ncbi:MAG: hypothetical protein ACE5FG_07930 [Myxococcota bacterium]